MLRFAVALLSLASSAALQGAARARLRPQAAPSRAAPLSAARPDYQDTLVAASTPFEPEAVTLSREDMDDDSRVKVAVVAPFSSLARGYKGATWGQVLQLMARRLRAVDESYVLHAVDSEALGGGEDLAGALGGARIVLAWNVQGRGADVLSGALAGGAGSRAEAVVSFDSADGLWEHTRLRGYRPPRPEAQERESSAARWWRRLRHKEEADVFDLAVDLWQRRSSDDLLYNVMLLGHTFAKPVPLVGMALQQADLQAVQCMCGNCWKEVVDCIQDPTCKAALDCLDKCAANDQVCSYRCITCHETPKFTAFSLCVLEKHNCLRKTAEAPQPIPPPLASWRGEPLTDASAEKLLVGWLGVDGRQTSWMVHQGQSSAYDRFPCQHQIFYPGRGRGVAWYDPTFQVILPDGERVWRRRHYRVRRDRKNPPGSYFFTVLDNGVTSNEQWRILDADDASDIPRWIVFFYSGAAKAAGQAYAGSLVCTADGVPPDGADAERIAAALTSAGVQPWEMYTVSNDDCKDCGAPLGVEAQAVKEGFIEQAAEEGRRIDVLA